MGKRESAIPPSSVSVEEYYAEEFFEKEKKAVWSNSWLLAGRISDLIYRI